MSNPMDEYDDNGVLEHKRNSMKDPDEWERQTYGRLAQVYNNPSLLHDHQLVAAIQLMTQANPMKDTALILLADAARRHGSPEAWINLGSLLAQMDPTWFKACRTACSTALELYAALDRNEPDAAKHHWRERAVCYHNLSVCHMKAGALKLADTYSRWAIALWPQRAVMWFQLGSVLARLDSVYGEGGEGPDDGGFWWRRAIAAYRECARLAMAGGPESMDAPDVIIPLSGYDQNTHDGKKRASRVWGDPDASTRTGMRVLAETMIDGVNRTHTGSPKYPHWDRWLNYPPTQHAIACYRTSGVGGIGIGIGNLSSPIGIYMEQGLGDQIEALPYLIQFVRAVVKFHNSIDGRVWGDGDEYGQWLIKIVCPEANRTLISKALNAVTLGSLVDLQSAAPMDEGDHRRLWIGHMDIPAILNRTDWPFDVSELTVRTPIRDLSFELEKKLLDGYGIDHQCGQPEANIGLCWHGSPAHPGDWARSIKDDLIAGIVTKLGSSGDPPARLFSVQRAYYPGQIKMPLGVRDMTPQIGSTVDLATLLTGMDAVVTVDTVVAHLCRLLGIRCYMVLPYHPDSRWGLPPWCSYGGYGGDEPDKECPCWSSKLDSTTWAFWQNPPEDGVGNVRVDFSAFPTGPEATEPDYACYSMAQAFQAAYKAALRYTYAVVLDGGQDPVIACLHGIPDGVDCPICEAQASSWESQEAQAQDTVAEKHEVWVCPHGIPDGVDCFVCDADGRAS